MKRVEVYKNYINGQWIDHSKEQIDVINPATGEKVGHVPRHGKTEATIAVEHAHQALKTWKFMNAKQRSAYLYQWHTLIKRDAEQLARTMTLEQGKPIQEALAEIHYANSYVLWYAEEAKRLYGQTIPASVDDKKLIVQYEAVGVVAAITPWNFPAAMITRKVAPALAAGCTVLLKPSELTPLTALKLVELADEAGIPKGVINVLTGTSREIVKVWTDDARVRKLTFTGSTAVGKTLMRDIAQTVKKVSLELGGHAPFIIFDDAQLEKAVEGVVQSKFRNAGQTCICTNRVYVQHTIAEKFTNLLRERIEQLKVGNGLESDTEVGPLINQSAIDWMQHQVEDALEKGAQLVTGGKTMQREGFYYAPTLLIHTDDTMSCMTEETFGPIIPVATFETMDEVVEKANDSIYGLAAYVYTQNLSQAITISDRLEYGIVGLNDSQPSTAQAPFGGFKESGMGREGGKEGLMEYVETKYISLHY